MPSDELISRIDRHLGRGNELAERNLVAFERNSGTMDRIEVRRSFAEIHEGFADQRRALLAVLDRLPPPS